MAVATLTGAPARPAAAASAGAAAEAALARLLVLEEQERGALAGRLHDGPVQDLVATRYLVDLTLIALRRGAVPAAAALLPDRVVALREGAQDALVGARRMLSSLTARCVDGRGLPAALAAVGEAAEAAGLAVHLTVTTTDLGASEGDLDALPPATAVLAWRCVQALLMDVTERAAGSASVRVRLRGGTPSVLEVGVDASCEPDLRAPAVAPWIERVRLVGGTAGSSPTGVLLRLPLPVLPATPDASEESP